MDIRGHTKSLQIYKETCGTAAVCTFYTAHCTDDQPSLKAPASETCVKTFYEHVCVREPASVKQHPFVPQPGDRQNKDEGRTLVGINAQNFLQCFETV